MKDIEINIAIAVACGWCGPTPPYHLIDAAMAQPEDYCNDLNAMHEAEKAVLWSDNALWQKYTDNLNLLSKSLAPVLHASARQRAEAFLRTKGLWREAVVEGGK